MSAAQLSRNFPVQEFQGEDITSILAGDMEAKGVRPAACLWKPLCNQVNDRCPHQMSDEVEARIVQLRKAD
jgi:hypothetical protein